MKSKVKFGNDIVLEVKNDRNYLRFISKDNFMIPDLRNVNYAEYISSDDMWIFSEKDSSGHIETRYLVPNERVLVVLEEEK